SRDPPSVCPVMSARSSWRSQPRTSGLKAACAGSACRECLEACRLGRLSVFGFRIAFSGGNSTRVLVDFGRMSMEAGCNAHCLVIVPAWIMTLRTFESISLCHCSPIDSFQGMRIIGVVGDVRQRGPELEPMPECYMPYGQHAFNGAALSLV